MPPTPHAAPTYPSDHAWLLDWPDVGDCLLSRKEAIVVDVLARDPVGFLTLTDIRNGIVDALSRSAGDEARSTPRNILDRAGHVVLDALNAFATMSASNVREVVGSLHGKGLVEPLGDMATVPGSMARTWKLTDAGRSAAALVVAMGREAADRMDPAGRGARLSHEALDAILAAGALSGVIDSGETGYRVEALVRGAYATVAHGTCGRYRLIQSDILTRVAAYAGTRYADAFEFLASGGLRFRVDVAWQPHPLGMRAVLGFDPIGVTDAGTSDTVTTRMEAPAYGADAD